MSDRAALGPGRASAVDELEPFVDGEVFETAGAIAVTVMPKAIRVAGL